MADRGHILTETILAEIEDRCKEEYEIAAREMRKKYRDYMAAFEEGRKQQYDLWQAGKISKEEYTNWVYRHTMIGKRWEKMADTLAADMQRTNEMALAIAQGRMPDVFALNGNYATYQIEHDGKIDTGFTLYNHDTAAYLMEDRQLMPGPSSAKAAEIAADKTMQWNKRKIQSAVLQGVLQGESPYQIADRLRSVAEMNYHASVRYARTMTTSAQNAGRYESFHRADKLGVDLTLEWQATLDGRTRHTHRLLHGMRTTVDKPFVVDGVKIMYPAQSAGPGASDIPQALIWNCRCTILAWVKGFEGDTVKSSPKMGEMTYDEWKHEKEPKQKKEENIYEKIGNAPKRPRRSDFEDYDEYVKAREQYKESKQRIEEEVGKWFDEKYSDGITDSELLEWADKNGVVICGDLEGLDRRALKAYTERYEQLATDFPMVGKYHEALGTPFEISYTPDRAYDAEASFGMAFGGPMSNYRNCVVANYTAFTNGEFVRGYNPAIRTFDHEFGHQLYFAICDSGIEKGRERFNEVQNIRKDFLQSVYGKNGMSEYATTNEDELFAEAFAAWYGGETTEFALSFGSFLRRHRFVI